MSEELRKDGEFIRTRASRVLVMLMEHIGDVVNATGALHCIRKNLPNTVIIVSAGERALGPLENSPDFDILVSRPKKRDIMTKARYLMELRQHRADAAIVLDDARSQARNAKSIGIQVRTGLGSLGTHKLTSSLARIPHLQETHAQFEVLLEELGFADVRQQPRLYPSKEDMDYAKSLLAGLDRPVVGFHPGASERTRRWPVEYFVQLSRLVEAQGYAVVITGSEDENGLCAQIPGLNLAGNLTVNQLAALIQSMAAFVVNDTGPMHICATTETPLVALYGSTLPVDTRPYGENYIIASMPCSCMVHDYHHCTMSCLRDLTPANVFAKFEEALRLRAAV